MDLDLNRLAQPDADATAAMQAGIDRIAADGGGVLRVSSGRWPIAQVRLRDRVLIELAWGAVLEAIPDPALYPPPTAGRHEDHGCSLIRADGIRSCGIIGRGTIRCRGMEWWDPPEPGGRWFRFRPGRRLGPVLEFNDCADVILEDIRIEESPGWTVLFWCCDRVSVRGITIDNHLFGPNTDGIDLNGCRDVRIESCRISTGDDAVVIKTSRNSRACERIMVRGCQVRSHCGAFKIGTEVAHPVRDIVVADCTAAGSNRIVGVYLLDGGLVERVQVRGISGDTDTGMVLNRPIHVDVRRRDDGDRIGQLRDLLVDGFHCRTDGRVLLTCEAPGALQSVTLRDIVLRYAHIDDPAASAVGALSSQFSNRSPEARAARAAVVVDGCEGLTIDGLAVHWPDVRTVLMELLWCRRVHGLQVH